MSQGSEMDALVHAIGIVAIAILVAYAIGATVEHIQEHRNIVSEVLK